MCLERRVPVSKIGLRRVKGPGGVWWFEAFKVFHVVPNGGGVLEPRLEPPVYDGYGQMSSDRAYSPAPKPERLRCTRATRRGVGGMLLYPAGFHCYTKRPQAIQYLYRSFLNQGILGYCLRRVLVRDIRAAGYQWGRRVVVVGRMFICRGSK